MTNKEKRRQAKMLARKLEDRYNRNILYPKLKDAYRKKHRELHNKLMEPLIRLAYGNKHDK